MVRFPDAGYNIKTALTIDEGIVTQFTIKAYPIGKVWGGMRIYGGEKADEIYEALHSFVVGNADDPKAAIILTDVIAVGGTKLFIIFFFYGEPKPPTTGPFAQFLDIESTIDSTSEQSYADLASHGSKSRSKPLTDIASLVKGKRTRS